MDGVYKFLNCLMFQACSLYFHINCSCEDIVIGIGLDEADFGEESACWREKPKPTRNRDGYGENSVAVMQTVAALCV